MEIMRHVGTPGEELVCRSLYCGRERIGREWAKKVWSFDSYKFASCAKTSAAMKIGTKGKTAHRHI